MGKRKTKRRDFMGGRIGKGGRDLLDVFPSDRRAAAAFFFEVWNVVAFAARVTEVRHSVTESEFSSFSYVDVSSFFCGKHVSHS